MRKMRYLIMHVQVILIHLLRVMDIERKCEKVPNCQRVFLQKSQGPCHDYFYSLKNVSFCAFHPRDHRYLGFITKHPTLQRFACHVFIGQESTRPVAEAVGWAPTSRN